MKKLIEHAKSQIACDNTFCGYKIDIGRDEYSDYLDKPCPICGENLLTETDYKSVVKTFKFINFVNRYFSWITIFMRKPIERKIVRVHTHDGIKIDEVENIE